MPGRSLASWPVLDLRLDVEQLEDADAGRHRPLQVGVVDYQRVQRVEEALDVQGEGHDHADLDLAVERHASPEVDHQRQARRVQHLYDRRQPGLERLRRQTRLEVRPVGPREDAHRVFLGPQALYDPDPGDRLLKLGVEVGERLARPAEGARGKSLPYQQRAEDHGDHRERHRGQQRAHREHDGRDGGQQKQGRSRPSRKSAESCGAARRRSAPSTSRRPPGCGRSRPSRASEGGRTGRL